MMLKAITSPIFWLLSYLGAVFVAALVIGFCVFMIEGEPLGPLDRALLNALGLSSIIAVLAFVPAVLCSGVWEMLGYRPPIVLLTVLGAATGTALPVLGALQNFSAVDADYVIATLVFTSGGAAGGFTFGWCRRFFQSDGNR